MTSDLLFGISRTASKWDGYRYTCRECGAEASAVGAIDHESDCYVGDPRNKTPIGLRDSGNTTYKTDFSESTLDVLRSVVRHAEEQYRVHDDTIDEITDVLADLDGVRWTAQGSAHRSVAFLGRTTPHGEFHLPDHRGVVIKIDPRTRFDEEYTPVSANMDEIMTWETAVETDTTMFFADMLATAPDGIWLAMEYCIPISLSVRNPMKTRDMIHDRGGEDYIYPLVAALKQVGWENPDYKYANVGLKDEGHSVLIDYGTGPNYQETTADSNQSTSPP